METKIKSKKKNEMSELGIRLKRYIKARGLEYAGLERKAGVRQDTIRQLCSGYIQNTSFDVGCKIALALGMPPEELAGLTGRDGFNVADVAPHAKLPQWYRMAGDYMAPAINDEDVILVDFGVISLETPGIYLINLNGEEVVRRLASKGDKIILAVSNNEYASLNDVLDIEDVTIVGKVLGKFKKI